MSCSPPRYILILVHINIQCISTGVEQGKGSPKYRRRGLVRHSTVWESPPGLGWKAYLHRIIWGWRPDCLLVSFCFGAGTFAVIWHSFSKFGGVEKKRQSFFWCWSMTWCFVWTSLIFDGFQWMSFNWTSWIRHSFTCLWSLFNQFYLQHHARARNQHGRRPNGVVKKMCLSIKSFWREIKISRTFSGPRHAWYFQNITVIYSCLFRCLLV